MKRIRRAGGRLFNFLGGLIAIVALIVVFVRELQELPRSAFWPSVQGTVVTSGVRSADDDISLDFEYRYIVDGVPYTNDRATFFEYVVMSSEGQIRQFVDDHPVESRVTVTYNPADPNRAFIMRTVPLSELRSPILLALCLGSTLFLGMMGFIFRFLTRGLSRRARGLSRGFP